MTRQELLDHYEVQLSLLVKELMDAREFEAAARTVTVVQQIGTVLDELCTSGVEEEPIRLLAIEPWHVPARGPFDDIGEAAGK